MGSVEIAGLVSNRNGISQRPLELPTLFRSVPNDESNLLSINASKPFMLVSNPRLKCVSFSNKRLCCCFDEHSLNRMIMEIVYPWHLP